MSKGRVYGVELFLGSGEKLSFPAYGNGHKDALMNLLVANKYGSKDQIELREGNSLLATRIGEATCSAKARVISTGSPRKTEKIFYITIRTN